MSFLPRSRPHPFSRNRSLLLPTESIVSSCTPFRIISPVPHLYRSFRFLGYVFGYLCTLQYHYILSLLEFDLQSQNKAVSLCLLISPALFSFPLIALSKSQTQALFYHFPLIARPPIPSIYRLFHSYILPTCLFFLFYLALRLSSSSSSRYSILSNLGALNNYYAKRPL